MITDRPIGNTSEIPDLISLLRLANIHVNQIGVPDYHVLNHSPKWHSEGGASVKQRVYVYRDALILLGEDMP